MTLTGFITNLADYNNGKLNGEWITFPMEENEIEEVFDRLGIDEEHEYFFTDWEDFTCLGMFANIEQVNELAERLIDVDEEHFLAYQEACDKDLESALDNYDDSLFYPNTTLREVAEELVDCYNLPDFALNYFDYDALERDLGFNGYYETTYGVICV